MQSIKAFMSSGVTKSILLMLVEIRDSLLMLCDIRQKRLSFSEYSAMLGAYGKNSMSLVTEAATATLPDIQYMDQETHAWILAHNPYSETLSSALHIQHKSLLTHSIDPTWFYNPDLINSLHGMRHLLRTATFCILLAEELQIATQDMQIVVAAGLLHDIRRYNDKADEGHATRSAQWIEENALMLLPKWGMAPSPENIAAIVSTVALHETPYIAFTAEQQQKYASYKTLVDILKTADALDRYRLPKLRWWINDTHLVLHPSEKLKQQAYHLVAISEGAFLAGSNSTQSVLDAVETM